jgi:chromosome segregation ATPase
LQNQHRKGKQEGFNAVTELAAGQPFQEDEPSMIQESSASGSELEEEQINFDEFKKKYVALKQNLHAMREERDALQRDKDKLLGLQRRMNIMLEKESGIQKSYLKLTQEKDSLGSEHEELKIKYAELERECSALKGKLNDITEKCGALQREKDKLVGLEGRIKVMLDEESGILKAHMVLTQERDTLRAENKELKLNKGCSAQEENLNVINPLQRDEDNLVGLEHRLNMLPGEQCSIEMVRLMLTQLSDTLKSEHDHSKVDSDELRQQISMLKENLNVIEEVCDALQKDKHEIVDLVSRMTMIVSSIEKAHFVVTQERNTLRSEQEEFQVIFDYIKRACTVLKELEDKMKVALDEKSSIQQAHFIVIQERNTLKSERDELQNNLDELKRECLALKEELNAIREERDDLQRDKDNLAGLEGKLKVMFDQNSSTEDACLIMTQQRDYFSSKLKEQENELHELKRECLILKENLNAVRNERDDLQKDKNKLVGVEGRLKVILDEKSSFEKASFVMTQEKYYLSLKLEEQENELHELKRECLTLKENLNTMRNERDALQSDKDKLVGLEVRMKKMLDEKSNLQKTQLKVIQERDTLKSERDELEHNFDELNRECLTLKENLNTIREERDALQRDKEKLVSLEGRMEKTLDENSRIKKERDSLRSALDELGKNVDKLKRECLAMKENLNSIRTEDNALQRDEDELLGLEGRMNMKSSNQEAHFTGTQDGNILRSECNEMEADFDRLISMIRALKENLKGIGEECNGLQMGITKFMDLAGRSRILDKLRRIQRAHLLLTPEKDTLRLQHEKVNAKFDKLERECSCPKITWNNVREKCGALHWDKDDLVQPQAMFLISDGESSIETPHMRVTPEKESLKSKYKELKARYEKLESEYISLTESLNAFSDERDALRRNKDKLLGLERRMDMILDEHLSIQNAHFLLNEERSALRSEQGPERRCFWTRM